jgi:hypothetical protein
MKFRTKPNFRSGQEWRVRICSYFYNYVLYKKHFNENKKCDGWVIYDYSRDSDFPSWLSLESLNNKESVLVRDSNIKLY